MAPLLGRRRRRSWKTLALLAAVIAALAALLASGAVAGRPNDYRVYAAQEEGFIAYRALPKEDGADQPFHQLTPEWVPEGFALSDRETQSQDGQSRLIYRCQGQENQGFSLCQWHCQEHTNTLIGNYHLENVRMNGEDAIFFSRLDPPDLYLLWTQGADAFLLHGWGFPREDLFRIAESLKW